MVQATPRQRWALFCMTKQDYRDVEITMEEASRLINLQKERLQSRDSLFDKVWLEAWGAGLKAGLEFTPVPMIVEQHTNPLDDVSPVKKLYHVPSGVCGFAWVRIGPATHPFCRWLKKKEYARTDGYWGGASIWIKEYGQSYERKMAHALAMARIISAKIDGLKYVHADGRLD